MREAGILLSVTSLPSKYGIGSFSKEAYEFIDFLKRSGQSVWQVLPLGPTGYGDSPYQSFSAFAGNPYFIDIDELIDDGLLDREKCDTVDFGTDERYVDYGKIYKERFCLLKEAYNNSLSKEDVEFEKFRSKNSYWLCGYAKFMALKEENDGILWNKWDKNKMPDEKSVRFWEYLQYRFFKSWDELKAYANKQGIKIIGDMPIYCAYDSADVWENPHLFELNKDGSLKAVAGCPPDGFSQSGQLWGNPLYDWNEHKKENYNWWIERIKHAFKMYDILRIDHFRGFDEYYSVKYPASDAREGEWRKANGKELFKVLEKTIGKRDIIAEDLGFITDSVRELLKECGFSGMKIFEFAFDERDENGSDVYLPHNYHENSVAYTATHDNEPVTSWFSSISNKEQYMVRNYLCDYKTDDKDISIPFISRIMQSSSRLCIVPIQDYLKSGSESRMNTPSTASGNWRWRILKEELSDDIASRIKLLTKTYGR